MVMTTYKFTKKGQFRDSEKNTMTKATTIEKGALDPLTSEESPKITLLQSNTIHIRNTAL